MIHDMFVGHALLAFLALTLAGSLLFADPTAPKSGTPGNGWDASAYGYAKRSPLVVEETTPTRAQVDWQHPQAKAPAGQKAPVAAAGPVPPLTIDGLNVTHLRFRDVEDADVPALLVTPKGQPGPFPVVIALHGLRSNKAQVVAQVAPALAKRGFAVLAPDMPLHGERPGDPAGMFDRKDLKAFGARMRQSIVDVRLCIDVAESRPELDAKKGVTLVGYSMGAILNAIAGPADPRVKAMCLMVGGTVDFPPALAMIPQLAAMQPQLAIAHFAGRPLLMLNATADHVITKEMADRLFNAAPDPKQQIWYESGHLLPESAYAKCADWVATTWKTVAR